METEDRGRVTETPNLGIRSRIKQTETNIGS